MMIEYATRRFLSLVGGWLLVGMAISVIIRVDVGAAPYDVLNVGVGTLLGVAPGTAMWLTGAVLVAVAWLLGERPGLATPAGFLAIGLIINQALATLPEVNTTLVRVVVLVPALAALYVGVCLIIVSRLGAGPTEVFMLALTRRGLHIRLARWAIEIGCAVLGVVLGGPLGALTVIIVLAAAPTISVFLPRVGRLTGLGVPSIAASS
jgi:uncharacterized membrane protein YczE